MIWILFLFFSVYQSYKCGATSFDQTIALLILKGCDEHQKHNIETCCLEHDECYVSKLSLKRCDDIMKFCWDAFSIQCYESIQFGLYLGKKVVNKFGSNYKLNDCNAFKSKHILPIGGCPKKKEANLVS